MKMNQIEIKIVGIMIWSTSKPEISSELDWRISHEWPSSGKLLIYVRVNSAYKLLDFSVITNTTNSTSVEEYM